MSSGEQESDFSRRSEAASRARTIKSLVVYALFDFEKDHKELLFEVQKTAHDATQQEVNAAIEELLRENHLSHDPDTQGLRLILPIAGNRTASH